MKIGIIIQARMGSSRLPGKVLKKIKNKTVLEHVVERARKIINVDEVIVATTENYIDDEIISLCELKKITFFRGSEKNVLERFFLCAKKYKLDHIVRLTADNPLVDVFELNRLVGMHLSSQGDYSESLTSLPIGIGAEILNFATLEKSNLYGYKSHHREHVNEYILENIEKFNCRTLQVADYKKNFKNKLSIDTIEDFNYISKIITSSPNDFLSIEDVIEVCSQFV